MKNKIIVDVFIPTINENINVFIPVNKTVGEVVKIIFLMELAGLNGREKLAKYDVESVICYEGK